MTETLPGWTKTGTRELFHYCGARIQKPRGKTLWTSRTVAGVSVGGFSNAASAAAWLEANDAGYWSYGSRWHYCNLAGLDFIWGSLDHATKQTLIVCSVSDEQSFPSYLRAPLRRLFLAKAICAKCGCVSIAIQLRRLTYLKLSVNGHGHYVVCECGHPVWRMASRDSFAIVSGVLRAERESQRRASIAEAGGRHSKKEIEEMRSLQENRCIYCNKSFAENRPFTKDHLVPIGYGGSNWSLNIVLACLPCNCRRNDMPFLTYLRLLSKAQRQRIYSLLKKRLLATDTDTTPMRALDDFFVAHRLDDPNNHRYVQILSGLAIPRENAKASRKRIQSS